MSDASNSTQDLRLFQAGPDEMIEYARTLQIGDDNPTDPLPSEAGYDAVAPISGSGRVSWPDGGQALVPGETVTVPRGQPYSITADPGQSLTVMVFGVSPRERDGEEQE